jgi:hypothetical protein
LTTLPRPMPTFWGPMGWQRISARWVRVPDHRLPRWRNREARVGLRPSPLVPITRKAIEGQRSSDGVDYRSLVNRAVGEQLRGVREH